MKAIFRKKKNPTPSPTNVVIGSGASGANKLRSKYVYIAGLVCIVIIIATAVVLLVRQDNATEQDTANDGGNPTLEIASSDAAGALNKVKTENGNLQSTNGDGSQSNGSNNSTSSSDGLPPPESMDYEASLETAANLSQTGASVEVVMAYYNRALALGGADNYAINLSIALYLLGTPQKQQATPFIDKAIVLLPTAGLDQETLSEQTAYLEELKIKAQS